MTLPIGTRLGPYEILGALGAGGMGEVYRGRDTRLDRSVAVKVLPSHFTADPERRARFEREAKAVSSLNHPHICTLYDVGREQGADYLVMELVEGETLAERLSKGPLPLDQTLRTAIEIADALQKAHRQGIIHRDLKPGNVMLTKAGSKLMDFGLAKVAIGGESVGTVSALPTASAPLTGQGTLLGTIPYMAPEQLEGKEADARSDLWAFGCLLYEMVTGRRAFDGKSQASLISAIMGKEPQPIAQLQPLTPPALERLVKVCLAKDPDDRLQTAHDVMQELKWIAEAPSVSQALSGSVLSPASASRRPWSAVIVGLALLVGGILGGLVDRRILPGFGPTAGLGVRRATFSDIAPPPGVRLSEEPSLFRLSDDGRKMVFLGVGGQGGQLWVRDLDSGAAIPLAGTEGAWPVAWSRDGRNLAFIPGEGGVVVKTIEVPTGAIKILTEMPRGGGAGLATATWNPEGDLLISNWGLLRVAPAGGKPTVEASPDETRGEFYFDAVQFLPDGRHYLFSVLGLTPEQSGVYVGVLGSAERRLVLPSISWAAFAPQGYLLFRRDSALFAQRFDPNQLETSGEPEHLVDGVAVSTWRFPTAWVGGDTLVYVGGATPRSQLTWFDRAGRESGRVGEPAEIITFDLSNDGARVVVRGGFPGRLSLIDTSRNTSTRLAQGVDAGDPRFSSDGQSVLFGGGMRGLFRLSLNGGSQTPVLLPQKNPRPGSLPGRMTVHDWSPDGRVALYAQTDIKTRYGASRSLATARPGLSCAPQRRRIRQDSRPTDAGSPTTETKQVARRSSSFPSRPTASAGRSQPPAGSSPFGAVTAGRSSISIRAET